MRGEERMGGEPSREEEREGEVIGTVKLRRGEGEDEKRREERRRRN